MTTTFLETPDNDLDLDARGALCIVTGRRAVASDARSAMQAQRGEMLLAVPDGMPTLQTAWSGYSPGQFEAAARAVILVVPEVLAVDSLVVSRDGDALRYDAVISTPYGPAELTA